MDMEMPLSTVPLPVLDRLPVTTYAMLFSM